MSARSCNAAHSHLDASATSRRRRRGAGSLSREEKPTLSQVFRENFVSCRDEPCGCGSNSKRAEGMRDGYRLRRSSYNNAHLRPSVCAMEHFLQNSTSKGMRKRIRDPSEHCHVMTLKKLRPSKLNCNITSIESTRSKEMVSHKYRTVNGLQRNGVSHAEKQKDIEFSDIKIRKSSRINRKDMSPLSKTNCSNLVPSIITIKKGGSSSHEELPEDWTQEHLLEPRKKEKRKSLDELQAPDGASSIIWRKELTRKMRKMESAANKVLGKVSEPEGSQPTGPTEELQRSLSGSEGGGLNDAPDADRKEEICSKNPVGNQNVSAETIHIGQPSRQQTEDLLGAVHEEGYPRQALCGPVVVEDSDSSSGDGAYEKTLNILKASSNDPLLLCKSLDHSGNVNRDMENEKSKDVMGATRQVDTLPVLTKKEILEELQNYDPCNKIEQIELRLKALEGKKCGLCGGNSKGEPAKYLIPVPSKTKDGQNSKTDQIFTGYSEWDAFGSEPGWLGPLLGPLGDPFGIAGVWIHLECAIWSPEVYFAGIGRIKNIPAALRRGKLLKCTRCTRPGATIGCRIGRCPRTYHVPCARFEGCYFDHKKFLMACDEHLHHFLPRLPGSRSKRKSLDLERIRFKRKITEWKKTAQRTAQLDAEMEEKWQEKDGMDEEFSRREWRRLQKDITRVAPVMVGGGIKQVRLEGWELIAGADNVIQCMKEMVMLPLLYPEAFAQLGVSPPRGVLLHGHPGTGKTLAVRALIGACAKGPKQIAYFCRKGADCLGKYAGDAERQLRILFNLAEKHQPSIIFFDEIDGLAPTRSQHQDQTQKSVVSTLLALMDGIKSRGSVVVIGATNRPDALDPALRRPGRFDREIYFPLPSFLDRTAILSLLTKNWQIPSKRETISLLASKTVGFAGADLQALCAQAAINSLRRTVSIDDLMLLIEKQQTIPSFPDLKVNAADWATAFGQVSPPCSWRCAKVGLNTVICAPVPHHILPVLLWPMVELLISLHLSYDVVLPPLLNKLASMLKETLQVHLGESWIDQMNAFLIDGRARIIGLDLEQALDNVFVTVGMVSDGKVRPATSLVQNASYKGSKFCVMLSGKERAWLDHFAAWLLFGFEGFTEICNLNLTTMLQEGGGDAVQGLINILGNVQNKSPCVIYMPQMESWAIESLPKDQVQQRARNDRQASLCWIIFIQQVNQLSSSLQIIFVASSHMRKDEFPEDVVDFFQNCSTSTQCDSLSTSGGSSIQERQRSSSRYSPRCWVEASFEHDINKVFSRAAASYAGLLCQELLCHGSSDHIFDPSNSTKPVTADELVSSSPLRGFSNAHSKHQEDSECPSTKETTITLAPETKPASVYPPDHTFLRIAISMLGYEFLYHPELMDLRHATSKLQQGPCFTSVPCVATLPKSVENNSGECDHVVTGSLKGLKAVGLLAYTGNYLKARDVAEGVNEVMALLMKQISTDINLEKDRLQFLHLFHKAALLQDKISLWAHNLRRFDSASSRPQGNAPEFSALKSKDSIENVAITDKILSETDKMEELPTALAHSPMMTSPIEPLHGGELDKQLQASQESSVFMCQKPDLGPQLNPPHMENSKSRLGFVDNTGMEEQQRTAMKYCPGCLNLVRKSLRKLFVRTWESRGSKVSLDVVDEVIGTCTSTIYVELSKSGSQGLSQNANLSCRTGCVCRVCARSGKDAKNKKSKSNEPVTMKNDRNLTEPSHECLCLLVKVIAEVKT